MTQQRLRASTAGEPEQKFLTVRETAAFLKLSEISIRRFLTQRKLKRFKVGSRTLIRLQDAESLIREA